jgi:hypothetical protein
MRVRSIASVQIVFLALVLAMLLACLSVAALAGPALASAGSPADSPGFDRPLLALLGVQQAQLTAADGAPDDWFGFSVAISGDTAVVGACYDDVGANADQGSAYVFTRTAGIWSQQQELTAADGAAGDNFGYSVAISGDTVVVGAIYDDVGENPEQGSAYVFVRTAGVWTQQQKLTAADGAPVDWFGFSVAVAGDTAVVGAYYADVGAHMNEGAAWVFTRTAGVWTQQQKLTSVDGAANDAFGYSVAVSGDSVVVGAIWDNVGANRDQGSAYIFVRSGTTWSQEQKLTAADGATDDYFGYSVAVSGDSVVVGAVWDNVGANRDQGSAYAFTRSATVWSQQAKLTAADGATDDCFGWSISLSGDSAVVGTYGDNVGTNVSQGSAYVFSRSGTEWSQQSKLTATDGAAMDFFGMSVAVSGDTTVVGAVWDDLGASVHQGSAYVFIPGAAGPAITAVAPPVATIGSPITITGSAFGDAQGTVTFAGVPAAVTTWTATQVDCTAPVAISGQVELVLTSAGGLPTFPVSFSVKPKIGGLRPSRGKAATTVTITGSGFGTRRGTSKVYFGGKAATKYVSWGATKIRVKVPRITKGRKAVKVKTSGGTSNVKYFRRI